VSYIIYLQSYHYCYVKFLSDKEAIKQLGKRVIALREQYKMSQADLCYEADIDLSTLSRLERGILNVTYITLYKIAKAFKIPIKDLLDF
jgi:transcriptional regulator with XRE-family HTH domain